ncbi:MAG: trigger factor, partial [Candidatus Thorarchaeota archaeon]
MKVSAEKTGPCEYEVNLEVESERLVKPLHQAARRLNTRRPLSGFRPGKAPYDLVERAYGKEAIYDAMLDKIGNQLYQEALQEAQIEPYTQAQLEIVQLEPLVLKFTVQAQPEVTLGDYCGIQVQRAQVTVSDEEIEQTLAQIRDEHALWVPAERAVKMGDQ